MLSDTVSPSAQTEQGVVTVALPSIVSLKTGLIILPSSTVVMLKDGQQTPWAVNATSVQRNSSASIVAAASESEAQVSPPPTSMVGSTIVAAFQLLILSVRTKRGAELELLTLTGRQTATR